MRPLLLSVAADHPRGCGENGKMTHVGWICGGSPPRMRGKLNIDDFIDASLGITPADAGKTYAGRFNTYPKADHPRGCGETLVFAPLPLRSVGSPPRMRGKLRMELVNTDGDRITPADAGKTLLSASLYAFSQDHPLGCGENRAACRVWVQYLGSPPRMRGKQQTCKGWWTA